MRKRAGTNLTDDELDIGRIPSEENMWEPNGTMTNWTDDDVK